MIRLLLVALWFNILMVVLSIALAFLAVYQKELQESLPFLVSISILAITSTHVVGTIMTVASIKELKELKKK